MKLIGYYREIFPGEKLAPPMEFESAEVSLADREVLIRYLRAGTPTSAAGGVVKDAFDASKVVGPMVMMNDGVWEWPSTLAYYVEKYGCSVSSGFFNHVLQIKNEEGEKK